jgi:acetyl-CoA acetyltransferase
VGAVDHPAVRRPSARRVQVAELHAPFTHQEIILRRALGLGDDAIVNPSGGALAGIPMFAAGLARIGWAARAIVSASADVALGHATSGPALQQNLVCVLGPSEVGEAQ